MKKISLIILMLMAVSLASRADVTINATNFPDAKFRAYLQSEYPSGVITTAQLNERTTLEVNNMGISDMKGVEYFAQLTRLSCYGNNLTSIDVSNNTKLIYLNVFNNQLTSITGLGNCTVLEQLYLHLNNLTGINVNNHSALRTLWVRDNPDLTTLNCYRNVLTNLDVANCTALSFLRCYENPELSVIQGLASCTALTYLDCEDCAITNLSAVKSLPNMEKLYARNNSLTTLNISGLSNLSYLRVTGNNLMTKLVCSSCALTELYVTGCTALTELDCRRNSDLSSINGLADCVNLTQLICSRCDFAYLSAVSNLTKLEVLQCAWNNLTSLDLSNCPNLVYVYCNTNQIKASAMASLVASLPERPANNRGSLYVIAPYEEYEGNEITDEQIIAARNKNWRPLCSYEEGVWDFMQTINEAANVEGGNISFTNDSDYPWTVKKYGYGYYVQSGNAGVASSTSTLTAVVTAREGDYVSFDFKAWGEGSSTYWDKCSFRINGAEQISYGAYQNSDWETYSVFLFPGVNTLEWTYSKDSSVNPEGDYFAIRNVAVISSSSRGDVDGDGNVSISDVTALIDYLLSGNASAVDLGAADCDEDGNVSIADVTSLIDYLLSGSW